MPVLMVACIQTSLTYHISCLNTYTKHTTYLCHEHLMTTFQFPLNLTLSNIMTSSVEVFQSPSLSWE